MTFDRLSTADGTPQTIFLNSGHHHVNLDPVAAGELGILDTKATLGALALAFVAASSAARCVINLLSQTPLTASPAHWYQAMPAHGHAQG